MARLPRDWPPRSCTMEPVPRSWEPSCRRAHLPHHPRPRQPSQRPMASSWRLEVLTFPWCCLRLRPSFSLLCSATPPAPPPVPPKSASTSWSQPPGMGLPNRRPRPHHLCLCSLKPTFEATAWSPQPRVLAYDPRRAWSPLEPCKNCWELWSRCQQGLGTPVWDHLTQRARTPQAPTEAPALKGPRHHGSYPSRLSASPTHCFRTRSGAFSPPWRRCLVEGRPTTTANLDRPKMTETPRLVLVHPLVPLLTIPTDPTVEAGRLELDQRLQAWVWIPTNLLSSPPQSTQSLWA